MNTPRIFLATAQAGDVIYALGGEYFPEGQMRLLNTVEWTRVNADGRLASWQEANPMLTPRRSPTAAVVGDYLYALGGYNGVFLRTVERAKILKAGGLGPWEWVPQSLTTSRYIHGGAAVGNRLYVVGGHLMESGHGSSAAEWATVGPDGQINAWTTTSALLQPRFLAGSAAANESIFVIGGYDGQYLSSVEEARILPDGNLGSWTETTPLPAPREGPAVTVHGKKIYVIGGSNNGVFLQTAQWAEAGPDGQLGYWNNK
jgi:N-acetylneuraminic acid mutarotase